MKIPNFTWKRRHNIAVLNVSFSGRIWRSRETEDMILGYNAMDRLCRVILLDPRSQLPCDADIREVIETVMAGLLRSASIRQEELDVLVSALARAKREQGRPNGTLPLGPVLPDPLPDGSSFRKEPPPASRVRRSEP